MNLTTNINPVFISFHFNDNDNLLHHYYLNVYSTNCFVDKNNISLNEITNFTVYINLNIITFYELNQILQNQMVYTNISSSYCYIQYTIIRDDKLKIITSSYIKNSKYTNPIKPFLEINWKSKLLWIIILSVVICCSCSCVIKCLKKSKKVSQNNKWEVNV